jgi:hypothetical protein
MLSPILNTLRGGNTLAFVCIVLFALFVSRTLFQPGYFTTHDGDFHIARTFHLIYELQQGQFPVRFATQAAFGHGYPTFLFFYPLP